MVCAVSRVIAARRMTSAPTRGLLCRQRRGSEALPGDSATGRFGAEEDALQTGPETASILCTHVTKSAVFGAHRPALSSNWKYVNPRIWTVAAQEDDAQETWRLRGSRSPRSPETGVPASGSSPTPSRVRSSAHSCVGSAKLQTTVGPKWRDSPRPGSEAGSRVSALYAAPLRGSRGPRQPGPKGSSALARFPARAGRQDTRARRVQAASGGPAGVRPHA